VRSAQLRAWGKELQEHIAALSDTSEGAGVDFRLRLVTLTDVYDPSDEADLTVEALRRRVAGMREAWRVILASVRGSVARRVRKMIGSWSNVEMSGTGHVHLHILYFGPYVNLSEWVELGREGYDRLGDIADVRLADINTVAQLAHYPIKTPGGAASRWLAGAEAFDKDGRPALSHPRLVARWEIALFGVRTGDRYGSFRGVKAPENKIVSEKGARPVEPCPCCGSTNWMRVQCSFSDWVRTCDRHGVVEHLGNPRVVNRRE
jgi:hypothetical protein